MASLALVSCLGGGGAGDDAGGGGGGGNGFCQSITGGNSTVTTSQANGCLGCSIDHPEAAADGDLSSFATVTAPVSFAGTGAAIKASAQHGIAFPAGQKAAVFFIPPSSSGIAQPQQSVTIVTYLSGEEQERPTSFQDRSPDETGTAYSMRSFTTSQPFDAVEVMVSNTQLATEAFEIHEICSDTNVQ